MMARAKAKAGAKVGAKGVKIGTEKELTRPGKLQSSLWRQASEIEHAADGWHGIQDFKLFHALFCTFDSLC
jgi:hypothetical protein